MSGVFGSRGLKGRKMFSANRFRGSIPKIILSIFSMSMGENNDIVDAHNYAA
jgi:hypothetical protein